MEFRAQRQRKINNIRNSFKCSQQNCEYNWFGTIETHEALKVGAIIERPNFYPT
jgi:hypothetical protein